LTIVRHEEEDQPGNETYAAHRAGCDGAAPSTLLPGQPFDLPGQGCGLDQRLHTDRAHGAGAPRAFGSGLLVTACAYRPPRMQRPPVLLLGFIRQGPLDDAAAFGARSLFARQLCIHLNLGIAIRTNELDLCLFLNRLFHRRLITECRCGKCLKIGRLTLGKRNDEDLLARRALGLFPSPIVADAEGLVAVRTVKLDGHRGIRASSFELRASAEALSSKL